MRKRSKQGNKIIKTVLSVVFVAFIVLGSGNLSYASWEEDEDGIHYTDEDGEYVTGFQMINGESYYFNDDGNLIKGKFYLPGRDAYYYSDIDGVIMVGAIYSDEGFFIADDTGKLQTGFVDYDGQLYYFNSEAVLVTGWFECDGKWYYAKDDGVILSGFINVNGIRYYLGTDGVRVSDCTKEIDGVTYVFNMDGSVDENTTAVYPLFEYLNELRTHGGFEPLTMNKRLQACANYRAQGLPVGYKSRESIEKVLSCRGVACDGGYEFAYGGDPSYNMERLFEDLSLDERFMRVVSDDTVSSVGLSRVEESGIEYYDIIFITSGKNP